MNKGTMHRQNGHRIETRVDEGQSQRQRYHTETGTKTRAPGVEAYVDLRNTRQHER